VITARRAERAARARETLVQNRLIFSAKLVKMSYLAASSRVSKRTETFGSATDAQLSARPAAGGINAL
jgi:hypothetical protein